MFNTFVTKSVNLIVPLVPTMISVQYFLRRKIENSNAIYDPDIYEPHN